jgi:hypothetical protein
MRSMEHLMQCNKGRLSLHVYGNIVLVLITGAAGSKGHFGPGGAPSVPVGFGLIHTDI